LKEKEYQINKLNKEISDLKIEMERFTHDRRSHHSLAVTNTIQRIEREKESVSDHVASLKMENDALNEKIKHLNESKLQDSRKIMELEERFVQLQCENEELEFAKNPAVSTIRKLREENCELQIKLRNAEDDYRKLNSSYNQLKLLNQQTETVLMDCQNQLEFSKCELHECETKINCLNKTNESLQIEMDKLVEEINLLKTSKSTVEREREFYLMSLDKKNEKLQCVESRVECLNRIMEENRTLKIKNE
jgi:chromosome segregation ATPase